MKGLSLGTDKREILRDMILALTLRLIAILLSLLSPPPPPPHLTLLSISLPTCLSPIPSENSTSPGTVLPILLFHSTLSR
jgi:hypothetical protein